MVKLQNHQGMTLIETLVTLLVIGLGIIALLRFQHYLSYENSIARQKAEATQIAISKIEQLSDYQVLNTTAGYFAYQDIISGSETQTGMTATYTLTWTVSAFINPMYKRIDLTVSWMDLNNSSQSIRMISNVAGIEPAQAANVM